MGRKLPGRKHKGVKDPEAQKKQREEQSKNKFNAPVRDVDEQECPRAIVQIAAFMANGGNKPQKKKSKKKQKGDPQKKKLIDITRMAGNERELPGMTVPLKPVPEFRQKPKESDSRFLWRVEQMTKEYVNQAKMEVKYNVDVVKDPKTGALNVISKKKAKKRKVVKEEEQSDNDEGFDDARLFTKCKKDMDPFSHLKDNVQFGETVHAPPQLQPPKRAKITEDVLKPGRKDLLFKKMDRTVKRKLLPPEQRQHLEQERDRVQDAYRAMKAKQYKNYLQK